MKITEAYRLIKEAINAQVPIMLWGPPGIGKSSIVGQVAKEEGLQLIDLRLPQLEPTDLRGVPKPNDVTGTAKWYIPEYLPRGDGKGILFLDEIEKAPTAVKNASLQLVLDRRLGDYKLPDGWSIVAAGNREEDGCFSTPLGSALCNRFMHVEVEPDFEAWLEWAKAHSIQDDILGFLNFRHDYLYKYTNENAFPSPRSWEMASKMVSRIKTVEDQNRALTAIIGKAVATEYRTWVKVYRNVDVEDILVNGKMPTNINEKDASFRYAVTLAVSHYVKAKGVAKIEANISKFVASIQPEMRVVFCRQLPQAILMKLCEHKSFKEISHQLMDIVHKS